MSDHLNAGQGQCHGTASLFIKPVRAVIELGASDDVRTKVLYAVHHANRRGSASDFVAVALPGMHMGRNCMLPGHEIQLFGSHESLSTLINMDGIQSLVRRGMLTDLTVQESWFDPGETGAAYVRDRSCAKNTAGWLRREKARAERRGKPWKDRSVRPSDNYLTALALGYGKTMLHVRQVIAEITDAKLMVNTYGFSSPVPGRMAVLPVLPDVLREEGDAA